MTARDTVLIALFAALTSALGLLPPIPVPLIPVPVTAQTFGVMLAGCLIGSRRAGLAMLLLLALLAMGLPLLSGGTWRSCRIRWAERGFLDRLAGRSLAHWLHFHALLALDGCSVCCKLYWRDRRCVCLGNSGHGDRT